MYNSMIRQIFLIVLSLSLSGALIGTLIAAVHPLTGRYFSKKWNYYIWLLVIVRLLLPFHFASVFPAPLELHAPGSPQNDLEQPARMITGTTENGKQRDDSPTAGSDTAHPADTPPDADSPSALRGTAFPVGMLTAAAHVWLLVAASALLVKLLHYHHFQKDLKKDRTRITDTRIITLVNVFCARLRIQRTPVIYESAIAHSPVTIGLLKPVIILPKAVIRDDQTAALRNMTAGIQCSACNTAQLQLILHHELIHIARRDLWYKWIWQLLLCVHWFNPVLRRIDRQISSDCELSCDEAILPELTETGRQIYGNILLDTAAQDIAGRQTALSTTLLENRKNLKKRLDGILQYKKTTRFRMALSACVFTLMLTLSACSTVWIAQDRSPDADSDSDGPLTQMFSTLVSTDSVKDPWQYFHGDFTPDRSSDAWKVYDSDELLAGDDILDYQGAYNYTRRNQNENLLANAFVLFGSDSFVIAYADRDIDVQITSAFEKKEGNFKIIFVAPDKSVMTLNDTGEKTTQTITMKKGRNVLKMVGQGGKLTHLKIDYSDVKESEFAKIFHSEDEEYIDLYKNGLAEADKDRLIDNLYYFNDDEAVSELFNTLLTGQIILTADDLQSLFIYSDTALSSQYLAEALRNKTIAPLSVDAISALMPYLEGDCQAEALIQLPAEDFYDTFVETIPLLDSSQIKKCLTHYINGGGTLTYSMFDEISPFIDESTKSALDKMIKNE